MASDYYYGKGRRKEAIATVRLIRGKGNVTINGKSAQDHFGREALTSKVSQPLVLLAKDGQFDITIKVSGGGLTGQADAARLAVSRALTVMNQDLRPTLKKAGFITRDSRVKERKKPGLKRARKAPQFTKR